MHSDIGEHDLSSVAAYIDDRLTPAERARMTRHLAGCEACRGAIAAYARAASQMPAASGLSRRKLQMIRHPYWLSAAAALMVATASTIAVRFDRHPQAPPNATPGLPQPSSTRTAISPSIPVPEAVPAPRANADRETPRPPDRNLLARRGGAEKRVGNKRFRLVAGEWIDVAFDPTADLPEVEVAADQRRDALARVPALAPYAALGPRVIVIVDGTVYRLH